MGLRLCQMYAKFLAKAVSVKTVKASNFNSLTNSRKFQAKNMVV